MGFFKKLFKKKKGGTFFGNLIRKGANMATAGILGNGADLQAWELKQQGKEQEAAMLKYQEQQKVAAQLGTMVGKGLKPMVEPAQKQAENAGMKMWLKRNWWKVAIPVVGVPLLIFTIVKLTGKKKGKNLF